MKVLYLLGLTLFSIRAECAPLGSRRGLAAGGETVFDVTKDGAVADGKTESTSVRKLRELMISQSNNYFLNEKIMHLLEPESCVVSCCSKTMA